MLMNLDLYFNKVNTLSKYLLCLAISNTRYKTTSKVHIFFFVQLITRFFKPRFAAAYVYG